MVAAALSGWLRGTVLSISVLSVTAGLVLAWTGIIDVSPWAKSVVVVELALVLTLFADGLVVERELLREHWTPAALALVVAMPVTLVLLALAGRPCSRPSPGPRRSCSAPCSRRPIRSSRPPSSRRSGSLRRSGTR